MKQLKASSAGRDMSRVFIVRPNFFSNSIHAGSSACTSWLLAYSVPSDVSDSIGHDRITFFPVFLALMIHSMLQIANRVRLTPVCSCLMRWFFIHSSPLGDGVIGESGAWTLVPVLTAEAVRSLSVGSLRPGKGSLNPLIAFLWISFHVCIDSIYCEEATSIAFFNPESDLQVHFFYVFATVWNSATPTTLACKFRPISRHLLSKTPHCFADPSNTSTHFTSLSTVLYTAWCGRYQILPVCSFWPLTSPAHPVFFDHSGVLKSFLMLLSRIVICAQLESSCQVTESHGAFTTVPLSTVNCCMVTCGEALTKSCVKFFSCCLTEMESSSQKFFHFRSVSSSIWAQLTWYFAIGNGVTALKTTHPNVVSIATGLLWSPHKIFSPRKQP
ncbi:hypothetical protein T02_9939 [Trichinella nativa]|uniref:Uncharacterized protein n=1 Tax=Trichinella nativa TaxID=6335 RepID=A0A0V1L2Y6_9BILA|nr:hypothetical protein T02_9939 [Trichinella nativa]